MSHFKVRWRAVLIPLGWEEIWFKFWMWECELAHPNFSADEIGFGALYSFAAQQTVQCFVTLWQMRNIGLVSQAPAQLEGMPIHDATVNCGLV